jgi:hypothetical protein
MKILPIFLSALCAVVVTASPAFAADEKAKPEPAALVESNTLVGLIPDVKEGWKGGPITKEERQVMGVDVSRAQQTFEKIINESEAVVTIAINDFARGRAKLDSMLAEWKEETDPENYVPSRDGTRQRLATVSGFPVYEEIDPKQQYQEFNVIVADRFLVVVQASNAKPEDAIAWLKAVDFKKLAGLK